MHRIVHEAPPPLMRPEVPHSLVEMISKLLSKHLEHRYKSMNDVEAALESFVTRSDGTPVPGMRRSQPMAAVRETDAIASAPTDIARSSSTMPRPARVANTPLPGSVDTLDRPPLAMKQVALPAYPNQRPYALYAVAGLGIAVGALGLVFGLKGSSKDDKVAVQPPAPAVQPQPAAAIPAPKEAQKIQVELEADAPNAHVTFRRRVVGSPTTLTMGATDVVE